MAWNMWPAIWAKPTEEVAHANIMARGEATLTWEGGVRILGGLKSDTHSPCSRIYIDCQYGDCERRREGVPFEFVECPP
jgi:hypothetical protein